MVVHMLSAKEVCQPSAVVEATWPASGESPDLAVWPKDAHESVVVVVVVEAVVVTEAAHAHVADRASHHAHAPHGGGHNAHGLDGATVLHNAHGVHHGPLPGRGRRQRDAQLHQHQRRRHQEEPVAHLQKGKLKIYLFLVVYFIKNKISDMCKMFRAILTR